ncbi:hypothetical protein RUM44_009814 [Polyplax serrata]|uniref:Uncharacterized protein n=1 Tax=Polyplax serrata TaxID=468196 RepID=A0ABR1ATU7_POLSC
MEKVEDEDEDEGIGDDIGDPCLHNSCVRACENQYREPDYARLKCQRVQKVPIRMRVQRWFVMHRSLRFVNAKQKEDTGGGTVPLIYIGLTARTQRNKLDLPRYPSGRGEPRCFVAYLTTLKPRVNFIHSPVNVIGLGQTVGGFS